MKNLIYVPLEHIDQRYTVHLDRDITKYLNDKKIKYIKVMQPILLGNLPKGMFLNAGETIKTKSHQIFEIAKLYEKGLVTNETTFFFSDLWFPGIESLAYLNYFYKVQPKITGFIHSGSFCDTDYARDMERWAKNFEDIIFDICDTIFVASEFIKQDILKKRIVSKDKLVVTPLPLDSKIDEYQSKCKKENIVIFNGRLCDEKQPWLFDELKKRFKNTDWKFIKTQEENLSKPEYYKLLAKSKAVVSFALQENFGYGIAEAVQLGCIPVLPNRLVYPEMYKQVYLFKEFEECVDLVNNFMRKDYKDAAPKLKLNKPFKTWFK